MSVMLTPDAQVPPLSVATVAGRNWTLSEQKPEILRRSLFTGACTVRHVAGIEHFGDSEEPLVQPLVHSY